MVIASQKFAGLRTQTHLDQQLGRPAACATTQEVQEVQRRAAETEVNFVAVPLLLVVVVVL
jgi:hypothetical protein